MNAKEALSLARARLLLDHPFFGVLALRLELCESPSTPTLAVNGKTISYNPDFILSLSDQLQVSAIGHEVMHCVLNHFSRVGQRNSAKWNKACDYAINPLLKEAGMQLGPGWLYNQAYLDMTAEQIYTLLPDEDEDDGGGDALCEIQPAGADAIQAEALAAEWKIATIQAAKVGSRGTVPGQVKQMLKEAVSPPIPWESELAMYMTERSKHDYSWRRPNPFFVDVAYIPSLDGVAMGEVVIAIDTSGSVVHILNKFGAVMRDIVNSVRPRRVVVIYCDADVNHVDFFDRGQELVLEAHGGGGTDFRPPFKYVQEQNIQPACFLYLTDMYGAFPGEPPPYPVLWCATTEIQGPFGQTIKIDAGG
jgi:predicted metal-dependent peptidase